MPPRPRVHDINERTFGQWYGSVPPVTRLLLTAYVITGLGLFFRVLPVYYFVHNWRLALSLPIPQLWRLLTNFLIIGPPSINYLFQLIWLMQYGGSWESARFGGNAADALTAVGVGMAAILGLDVLLPWWFRSPVHGPSLVFMFVYLWSRYNQQTPVSFFGVIKFNGLYLPFALMAVDMLQGASIMPDLAGILAGHLYHYLTDVFPMASGRQIIATPTWLARLTHRFRLGAVPVQQLQSPHPSDVGFRAFSGRGRRLAD